MLLLPREHCWLEQAGQQFTLIQHLKQTVKQHFHSILVLFVCDCSTELTHLKLQIGWHNLPLCGAHNIQPREGETVAEEFRGSPCLLSFSGQV